MIFGELLKELRKQKGWTLKDLALKSGLNEMSISNLENDINQPSPITLKKLSDALEYDYDKLYDIAFKEQEKEK